MAPEAHTATDLRPWQTEARDSPRLGAVGVWADDGGCLERVSSFPRAKATQCSLALIHEAYEHALAAASVGSSERVPGNKGCADVRYAEPRARMPRCVLTVFRHQVLAMIGHGRCTTGGASDRPPLFSKHRYVGATQHTAGAFSRTQRCGKGDCTVCRPNARCDCCDLRILILLRLHRAARRAASGPAGLNCPLCK